ncbi:MAG TPA: 4Fe-4S dicluster domain-containing protein [Methanothermococcus okinawensis]|nr:4Fe-4S dicluster domain-containing protein [Methanothermococcus okinawensis]
MICKKTLRLIFKHLIQREKSKKVVKEDYPNLDNCIVCGLCSKVCPTGAIKLFKFRDIICKNCGACIDVCPNNAITLDRFRVDKERCIKCGYCGMVCTLPVIKEEIPKPKTPVLVEDRCNCCGLCIKRCPEGAVYLKDNKVFIDEDKCKMCLSCIYICPMKAIYSPADYIKYLIVSIDIYSCISCRECEYVCPLNKHITSPRSQ